MIEPSRMVAILSALICCGALASASAATYDQAGAQGSLVLDRLSAAVAAALRR